MRRWQTERPTPPAGSSTGSPLKNGPLHFAAPRRALEVARLASADKTRYVIAGLGFRVRHGVVTVTATDGKVLGHARYQLPEELREGAEGAEFTLTAEAVEVIRREYKSPTPNKAADAEWLRFDVECSDVVIGTRRIPFALEEGQYPDTSRLPGFTRPTTRGRFNLAYLEAVVKAAKAMAASAKDENAMWFLELEPGTAKGRIPSARWSSSGPCRRRKA